MLDRLKYPDAAAALHQHLEKSRPLPWVELEPGRAVASKEPAERNARWNVIVRRLPEIDE